jgi:hypothetical protein
VRFSFNRFDNLALTGDVNSFQQAPSRTPELTNIGSFEKCWRLIDNEWWMLKAGKPEELFSELLIYHIGKLLGFSMAEYAPDGNFIKSRDFTRNASVNFEPAYSVIGDTADNIKIYDALGSYGTHVTDAYLQMCYLDAFVLNMDRHEHNFGLLRNSETGRILSLAPFFDHNIALISQGYPQTTNDALISDFVELIHYAKRPLQIRAITTGELQKLVRGIPWEPPVRDDIPDPRIFVVQYLQKRQSQIRELCRETIRFQTRSSIERNER